MGTFRSNEKKIEIEKSSYDEEQLLKDSAELEKAFENVPFTFSKNCRSGLLERCECSRCRIKRNETVNEETNKLAEVKAKQADLDFEKSMREWLENCKKEELP